MVAFGGNVFYSNIAIQMFGFVLAHVTLGCKDINRKKSILDS